jgi:hypothetical protein
MIKRYKWPLILVLGIIAGAFFVHDHFYQRGIRAVEGFSASYDRFDKAVSDLSASMSDDSESKARAALAELEAKAAFRLSSLIKNDGELMNQAREVAGKRKAAFVRFRELCGSNDGNGEGSGREP